MELQISNLPGRRVVFVDHVSKVLGGAEVNLIELLGSAGLSKRWQVVCACAPGSPLSAALGRIGVRQVAYSFSPSLNELRIVGSSFQFWRKLAGFWEVQRAAARLQTILRQFQPDAVISCTNKDHLAAGSAAAQVGIPSVWWINDIISSDFFSWPVRKLLLREARLRAKRLLAVSEFSRQALLAGGIPPEKAVTIHNGIRLEHYQRSSSKLLRELLRIDPREPLFGILGRITPWKGQDFFIRLAEEWIRQRRPGHFAIIGRAFNEDEPFAAKLRQTVRQRQLGDRIHFVPFQTDVVGALASLAVMLHCSTKPEPFGRVIIEAMASGVPVIASRGGGVPEIISENVDGGLATPGDISSYLNQMVALLDSRQKREAWVNAARRKVEAHFTLSRVISNFDAVFEDIAPRTAVSSRPSISTLSTAETVS